MTDELANPSLGDLEFLIGDWDMALSGASFLPDPGTVVHGRLEIRSIEQERLVVMRQIPQSSEPPAATWVIGRDAAQSGYAVLYADGRGVSRVYEMTLSDRRWRIWRNDPAFSQRFDAAISPDRAEIVGRWERRSSGGHWEHDFDIAYRRL